MSIREQAAALAETFGPTGVQIAHQIRALQEERRVIISQDGWMRFCSVCGRSWSMMDGEECTAAPCEPNPHQIAHDASPPCPVEAPGHTDLMITPEAIDVHLAASPAHLGTETRDVRQATVESWVRRAFGDETMRRPDERAARVLEEAMDLAQACGVPEATAEKIKTYVYARPVGNPTQEAGGVGLTLLACCGTLGISADTAEASEVSMVLAKPLEHWSRRWKEKSAAGITPGLHPEDRADAA